MILFRRISGRARTFGVGAAVLLLVCSMHHSFTAANGVGTGTLDRIITEARAAETTIEPSPKAEAEAEAACVVKWSGQPIGDLALAAPAPLVETPPPPTLALTFDDGPWPGQTEQILGVLADRHVPATFFMTGRQVEDNPALAQLVVSCGQAVGNHSYSHRRLNETTPDVVEWELAWTTFRIESVTGVHPAWVRPPGGNFSPDVYASIEHVGARPVLWTVDPQDWRAEATPEEIAWNVISTARPGGIILLHDGGGDQSRTIAALPVIIDALRAQGYQFVTLDQLPSVRGGW